MRAPVLLLGCLLCLTACSGTSATSVGATDPPSASAGPTVLAAGTSDLPLAAGALLSPDGFVPPLALTVPVGWFSARRGDDAFDLSRRGPSGAAPVVVVAFVTPNGDTSAGALAALRPHLTGSVTAVTGTLAGLPAHGFDVVGGSGQVLASPSGTLHLDAVPRGRLEVLGTDVDGVPLLAMVSAPDAATWPAQKALADALLAGVTPG